MHRARPLTAAVSCLARPRAPPGCSCRTCPNGASHLRRERTRTLGACASRLFSHPPRGCMAPHAFLWGRPDPPDGSVRSPRAHCWLSAASPRYVLSACSSLTGRPLLMLTPRMGQLARALPLVGQPLRMRPPCRDGRLAHAPPPRVGLCYLYFVPRLGCAPRVRQPPPAELPT